MIARRGTGLAIARFAVTLATVAAFVPATPVRAQQPSSWELEPAGERAQLDVAQEARASALASQLRCPVCQGVSIQDSPSPLAVQMKELIRTQVAEGRSNQEIRAYFVSKYGEWVLLEPPASGFNLLVYVLPALLLLGGAALLWVMVRRWSGDGSSGAAPEADEDAAGAGVARSGHPG